MIKLKQSTGVLTSKAASGLFSVLLRSPHYQPVSWWKLLQIDRNHMYTTVRTLWMEHRSSESAWTSVCYIDFPSKLGLTHMEFCFHSSINFLFDFRLVEFISYTKLNTSWWTLSTFVVFHLSFRWFATEKAKQDESAFLCQWKSVGMLVNWGLLGITMYLHSLQWASMPLSHSNTCSMGYSLPGFVLSPLPTRLQYDS